MVAITTGCGSDHHHRYCNSERGFEKFMVVTGLLIRMAEWCLYSQRQWYASEEYQFLSNYNSGQSILLASSLPTCVSFWKHLIDPHEIWDFDLEGFLMELTLAQAWLLLRIQDYFDWASMWCKDEFWLVFKKVFLFWTDSPNIKIPGNIWVLVLVLVFLLYWQCPCNLKSPNWRTSSANTWKALWRFRA